MDYYVSAQNIYNSTIFTSLSHAKTLESISDEPWSTSSSAIGRITCAVINTLNEAKNPLLREILIYNFSQRTLERVFVHKEWMFFSWLIGNESQRGTNIFPYNRFAVYAICLPRGAPIHPKLTQKKTLILY